MAFIYEMEFKVHSVIENLDDSGLACDEPEINIISSCGFLKADGERMLISYAESTEGGKVLTDLTVSEGEVRLCRKGAVEFETTFREGESVKSIYSVPPYSFDAAVRTKRLRCNLTKAGGELSILYSMNVGGQEKSVRLKITARPKARA